MLNKFKHNEGPDLRQYSDESKKAVLHVFKGYICLKSEIRYKAKFCLNLRGKRSAVHVEARDCGLPQEGTRMFHVQQTSDDDTEIQSFARALVYFHCSILHAG